VRMMFAVAAGLLLGAAAIPVYAASHEPGCGCDTCQKDCDDCGRQPLIGFCRKEICLPKLNLPSICDLFKCKKCNSGCDSCAPERTCNAAPACDSCRSCKPSCKPCKSRCKLGCGLLDPLGLFKRDCCDTCNACDTCGGNGTPTAAEPAYENLKREGWQEAPQQDDPDAVPEPPAPAPVDDSAAVRGGTNKYVRVERAAEPSEQPVTHTKASFVSRPRLINPANPQRLRHDYSPWPVQ